MSERAVSVIVFLVLLAAALATLNAVAGLSIGIHGGVFMLSTHTLHTACGRSICLVSH